MTLIVHHLQRSQSDRVVWLCEELGIPYELKLYQRDAKTLLAPPELKALHPAETAPILEDGDLKLSESSAIMQYIISKYGNGRLAVPPTAPNFVEYNYWFHWAIGTLQPTISTPMFLSFAGLANDPSNPMIQTIHGRVNKALKWIDDRLAAAPYLAGDDLTAADIYAVFTLSTMRLFSPFPLTGYNAIVQWLERCSQRAAYKAMIEKAEKSESRGEVPTIGVEAPRSMWSYTVKDA